MYSTTEKLAGYISNEYDIKQNQNNIGELYLTYRSKKSFFGYDAGVLKSGIQKYARRAEVDKGLWCLIEMDLFSLLEWDGTALDSYLCKYPGKTREKIQIQAKSIRTNMVNRLIVMMSEEVNISAWWMPLKMLDLYEKWIENRDNFQSQKYLVDMYLYLTSQKMIRLISDLKSVFLLPPDYVKAEQMDALIQIHSNIQKRYPNIYSNQAEIDEIKCEVDISRYPAKLQSCIKGIIYNLEKGSDRVFYWIRKLCDIELKDKLPLGKDKNEIFKYSDLKIVWKILHRFIDQHSEYEFLRETIFALQKFHRKMFHKEKPIYLHHAVLLLVRREEIEWTAQPPPIDTSFADVEKLYKDHLANGKMIMDDYVIDLHTKRGKKGDHCLKKFALEGAYVKNENDKFLRQDYREIYILLKKELDHYRSRGGKL